MLDSDVPIPSNVVEQAIRELYSAAQRAQNSARRARDIGEFALGVSLDYAAAAHIRAALRLQKALDARRAGRA